MTKKTEQTADIAPILACTISRDVQNFDLLIEDMEAIMGEAWGDLGFEEAFVFLGQPDADNLEFVALAVDDIDEENLTQLTQIISAAKAREIKVVLIAEDISPAALHQLLRSGADEFVPYPLPEGELADAVERLRTQVPEPQPHPAREDNKPLAKNSRGAGAVIAVQGMAGGVGTSTFAVNLAWELATTSKTNAPRVCILDLGLQFGSIATYLDLPRRDVVLELLSDLEHVDQDSFGGAISSFEDKISVLTAPADILPLDIIQPHELNRLFDVATAHFDYVIVDLPSTLVNWSEVVLERANVYFALMELDMRSAQNILRLRRALQTESLPLEKLRFVLNRAPRFTDLQGKSRAKRMAESLDISIDVQLPDGGKVVTQACDHGLPLASQASKNPLRKEIAKLAASLHEIGREEAEAA